MILEILTMIVVGLVTWHITGYVTRSIFIDSDSSETIERHRMNYHMKIESLVEEAEQLKLLKEAENNNKNKDEEMIDYIDYNEELDSMCAKCHTAIELVYTYWICPNCEADQYNLMKKVEEYSEESGLFTEQEDDEATISSHTHIAYFNDYIVHEDELDEFKLRFDDKAKYYYENAAFEFNGKTTNTLIYNAVLCVVEEETKKELSFWGRLKNLNEKEQKEMKNTNEVLFISDGNIFSAPPLQTILKKLSMRDILALQNSTAKPEQAYKALEKLLDLLPDGNEFKNYIYDMSIDEIDYITRAIEAWISASAIEAGK